MSHSKALNRLLGISIAAFTFAAVMFSLAIVSHILFSDLFARIAREGVPREDGYDIASGFRAACYILPVGYGLGLIAIGVGVMETRSIVASELSGKRARDDEAASTVMRSGGDAPEEPRRHTPDP